MIGVRFGRTQLQIPPFQISRQDLQDGFTLYGHECALRGFGMTVIVRPGNSKLAYCWSKSYLDFSVAGNYVVAHQTIHSGAAKPPNHCLCPQRLRRQVCCKTYKMNMVSALLLLFDFFCMLVVPLGVFAFRCFVGSGGTGTVGAGFHKRAAGTRSGSTRTEPN